MTRYLLDTDVLYEPARSKPNAFVVGRLRTEAHRCTTATAVWMELSYGALRLPPGEKRQRLQAYVAELGRRLPIVPFDSEAALWLATAKVRQRKDGSERSEVAGLIAATAASRGLTLVTRSLGDFSEFPGLSVESWHG